MRITPDGVHPLTFALEIAVIFLLESAIVIAIVLTLTSLVALIV
jgi:hypothetical protein